MEKIKIITDSTCDLPEDIIKKYDIEIIPLRVNVYLNSYRDRIDIDFDKLMGIIEKSGDFPTTSQINPDVFREVYEDYLTKGYKIISIHISSKLSDTYKSAIIAKNILQSDDIYIYDSLNVCGGIGILVYEVAKLIEKGETISKVLNSIENSIPKIKSMVVVDNLTNLVVSGRISKATGIIASILKIKPIISIVDGEMASIGKIRGRKKTIDHVINFVKNSDIMENTEVFIVYSKGSFILSELIKYLDKNSIKYIISHVGCVVGSYSGKNSCSVFLLET